MEVRIMIDPFHHLPVVCEALFIQPKTPRDQFIIKAPPPLLLSGHGAKEIQPEQTDVQTHEA